jgi:shikimate 5-dehydrogenase
VADHPRLLICAIVAITVTNGVQALSDRVEKIKEAAQGVLEGIASSDVAINGVRELSSDLRQSTKLIEDLNKNVHTAISAASAEGSLVINATVVDLEGDLVAAFAVLKAELRKQKAALDTNVKKGALKTMKDEVRHQTTFMFNLTHYC